MDWTERKACPGDLPPMAWFPDEAEEYHKGQSSLTKAAIALCATCPVQQECLDTALSIPAWADSGVWGGLTLKERKPLRRRVG